MPIIAGGGGTHYDLVVWLSPLRDAGGALDLTVDWRRVNVNGASGQILIPTQAVLRNKSQMLWPSPE